MDPPVGFQPHPGEERSTRTASRLDRDWVTSMERRPLEVQEGAGCSGTYVLGIEGRIKMSEVP
jgi:hypothetical protein